MGNAQKKLCCYRAATTYEAFNCFWGIPGDYASQIDEPVGVLWSSRDIVKYCRIHNCGYYLESEA
jgi:hypothetical protein